MKLFLFSADELAGVFEFADCIFKVRRLNKCYRYDTKPSDGRKLWGM